MNSIIVTIDHFRSHQHVRIWQLSVFEAIISIDIVIYYFRFFIVGFGLSSDQSEKQIVFNFRFANLGHSIGVFMRLSSLIKMHVTSLDRVTQSVLLT